MKTAVLGLMAISLGAWAQTTTVQLLKSDLQALRRGTPSAPAFTGQVSAHIAMLAERTHAPAGATLQGFSEALVSALAGHPTAQAEIDGMAGDIEQTMHSAGTSTAGFEDTVKDFERRLLRSGVLGVRAHLVASNLERVGKEVRGPEGAPVR